MQFPDNADAGAVAARVQTGRASLRSTPETVVAPPSPVCSYTEWDPLEEVIVGIVDGALVPPWHVALEAPMPQQQHEFFRANAGKSFPAELIRAANVELDEFVSILEAEGVTVRRPDVVDNSASFGAPGWTSTGLYAAMPRDLLLVFGNDIIECPLAWRSRYFETSAYRSLLKEYFHAGARWSAGPKPELKDELYVQNWAEPGPGERCQMVINEYEPTFDAADFVRCGRDVFAQTSNVTNAFGIQWLQRHLGDDYRIHVIDVDDPHAMHIDASLMPLAPGKVLVNAERVPEVPAMFRDWQVLHAPRPVMPDSQPLYMTSKWINMNVLMLDEERMMVEAQDEPMIRACKEWGFEPVPCNFRNFNSFGGSFHCATLDVRRRGTLRSYF